MSTENSPKLPVALIAGPTASGKSALALRLATTANGTIINADASQVYADLRILSARPNEDEEREAPHRLFGMVDGARACSAVEWAAAARGAIAEAHGAGRLPILVGGTGLYLTTLLHGIAPVPEIDPQVRQAVRALPVVEAHAALLREDPLAAARFHPADTARVARALEVVRATGRPIAHWQSERRGGIGEAIRLAPVLLLPPRDWLYARCDARFGTMLENGGIGEARRLLARGLDPDLPVMRAIGVPEIAAFLRSEIPLDAALELGARATRRYAKRQFTWFNNQPPADWWRIHEQLDDNHMDSIVIKLRTVALTA